MSLEKNLRISRLLDVYGVMLSDNQRLIMTEYYFQDKTLSEIAEIMNISRQAVLDAVKKSEEKLLELDNKFHLVDKIASIEVLMAKFKDNLINKDDFITMLDNIIKEI